MAIVSVRRNIARDEIGVLLGDQPGDPRLVKRPGEVAEAGRRELAEATAEAQAGASTAYELVDTVDRTNCAMPAK
jgi:hypothetical protein